MASVTTTIEIDGETWVAEVATVDSTHLGYEDHGIFTGVLGFAGPGWGQSSMARGFDEYDPSTKRRNGTAFGMDSIMRMVDVFGCGAWEKIKGQRCYVLRKSMGGFIEGIANIDNPDKHMIFKAHAESFYPR